MKADQNDRLYIASRSIIDPKLTFGERFKMELTEERGAVRSLTILSCLIILLLFMTYVLPILFWIAVYVFGFLAAIFVLNFIIPSTLVTIAFSAGAEGLGSALGITLTLMFIALRYLTTFVWITRWFWAIAIGVIVGLYMIFALIGDISSSHFDVAFAIALWKSMWLNLSTPPAIYGQDPNQGWNCYTIAIEFAMLLAIYSVGYTSWYYVGKALKYLMENDFN